jgi:hypothetical protein
MILLKLELGRNVFRKKINKLTAAILRFKPNQWAFARNVDGWVKNYHRGGKLS